MNVRHGVVRVVALTAVVSMPLLGMAGSVSAAPVGSAKWCANHPVKALKTPGCPTFTGGGPPTMTVQIDPNPLVETAQSAIAAVIQVETSSKLAGDAVNISSSQLSATCRGGPIVFSTLQGTTGNAVKMVPTNIQAILDDEGNVTVEVSATDCAPGPDVIEADLVVAPTISGFDILQASAPVMTSPGVFGYPTTSGTVKTGEVETGDTPTSGNFDVYAVFYVETDPAYGGQKVEIGSGPLEFRCLTGWSWYSFGTTPVTGKGINTGPLQTAVLDGDGNAVFVFFGSGCAAGPSLVTAEVLAGVHSTYMTTFTIDAPAPTI